MEVWPLTRSRRKGMEHQRPMDELPKDSYEYLLASSPSLNELMEHISIGPKWYLVGTMLEVYQKRLRSIQALPHGDVHKTNAMFEEWLSRSSATASRRQVLKVLRSEIVGGNDVAEEYERYLKEEHSRITLNTTATTPSDDAAVSILQGNIQSLSKVLVSPVQVSQLLYSKRCINKATLDDMETVDQIMSLDDRKATLLTAIQQAVSSDYRKLRSIAEILSNIEETRTLASEITAEYVMKISDQQEGPTAQYRNATAYDILRDSYGNLSQSITEPVSIATILHKEKLLIDQVMSLVSSARNSLSDSRAVLLKAVRNSIHSNHKNLELFVTVLKKFPETAHIADTMFKEYERLYPDGNSSLEEMKCYFSEGMEKDSEPSSTASSQSRLGHKILIPPNTKPEFAPIRNKFGSMFYSIRSSFTRKEISPHHLKKLTSDCFPDLKSKLEHKEALDDMLEVLKTKCSLIDVYCLEVILQAYKIKDEGLAQLNSYKSIVEKFCQSVPVRLCVDQVLDVIRTPARLTSEAVLFVLDWNPDKKMLQDVRNLLSRSIDANMIIVKIGISHQSVTVMCHCPSEYTGSLITNVLEKIEALQMKGLKELRIGNCTVWSNKITSTEEEIGRVSRKTARDYDGMESGLINWDSPFLEFIDPSLTQCQEAISKLTIKYSYVTLQSLSPAILSLLTTALLKIKSIQHISLQSTKLTKEFMLSFSSQLSLNNSLTFLSIYHSIDDDDGVIALTQSLKKNKTLTDLHLSSNPGITSGSAQSLAELLLVNSTLSVLSLTRTNIDTSGVLLVAESLRTNKTMRKLFIDRQHRAGGSGSFDWRKADWKERMDFTEATVFVREQLESMGVKNISRKELESYTIDFLKLLRDKEEETEGHIDNPSPDATPPPVPTRSVGTPITTPTGNIIDVSVNYVEGRPVTRKVLRRPIASGGEHSDSTKCSVNSSLREEAPTPSLPPQRQLKSFIRPAFTHPHTRGIKKNDPVQRYHEFRQMWESQKAPGEKKRNNLRWHIKEQMLCQDVPLYIPTHQPLHRSTSYVVPTEKKRQALRWEIRHQLAN